MEQSRKNRLAFIAFLFAVCLIVVVHIIVKPSVYLQRGNNQGEVVIKYMDNITDVQYQLIQKFNEENKGRIKVELVNFPLHKFSSHERKQLLTKFLRNKSDQVDVFSADQVWIARFSNWAEPLDKYLTKDELLAIEEASLKSVTNNNSIVALPVFTDVGVMYCNKNILKKHPDYEKIKEKFVNSITWEEFIEIGSSKYFKDYPFYVFPADNYEGLMCSFAELLPSDLQLFENEEVLQNPKVKSAAKFIVDLVNKYKIAPQKVVELQEINLGVYFRENNVVCVRGWPNSFSEYYEVNKNNSGRDDYLCVPLPHFKGKEKQFVSGGWNLMLSKYSKNKEAAIKFMKFWLREDVQTYMYENNGFLPTIKHFYTSDTLVEKYSMLKFYRELLKHSVNRPTDKSYTIFSDILTRYLKQAIKKEISVEEALSKSFEEIKSFRIPAK